MNVDGGWAYRLITFFDTPSGGILNKIPYIFIFEILKFLGRRSVKNDK